MKLRDDPRGSVGDDADLDDFSGDGVERCRLGVEKMAGILHSIEPVGGVDS